MRLVGYLKRNISLSLSVSLSHSGSAIVISDELEIFNREYCGILNAQSRHLSKDPDENFENFRSR